MYKLPKEEDENLPMPAPNSKEWKERVYYERVAEGQYIAYDIITGNVVGASAKLQEMYGTIPQYAKNHSYHPAIIDHICNKMVDQGWTLARVVREVEGFPPLSTIMRWKKQYPEVELKLDSAREMVAELFYSKIVEEADHGSSLDQGEAASEKLRFEKLKYLASVNNPYRYGNRTHVSGDEKQPIQFVISTGIDRGENHGTGQGFERKQRICGDGGSGAGEGADASGRGGADEEED